jgi:hypothetical protein
VSVEAQEMSDISVRAFEILRQINSTVLKSEAIVWAQNTLLLHPDPPEQREKLSDGSEEGKVFTFETKTEAMFGELRRAEPGLRMVFGRAAIDETLPSSSG